MSRAAFLTLVFPEQVQSDLDLSIRFHIQCGLQVEPTGYSAPRFVNEVVYLAPHLPFSIVPRSLASRLHLRLTPLQHEAGVSRFAARMGLGDAEPHIATLRFVPHLTDPEVTDDERTFHAIVLLPGPNTPPGRWTEAHFGADFFLEHQLRLFIDYGRLERANDPTQAMGTRFDPLVPCGHLEYPGDADSSEEDVAMSLE